MSKRGFITIGIDTDADRVKYSYALSLSIKNCDPNSETCLVVDSSKMDLVDKKYFDAFDYIVELPFGNTGYADGFHGSNFWQLAHCTPFDETIYIDSDSLFLNVDIDLLWDQFENVNIGMTNIARTFRNGIANKNGLFDIEATYNLPQQYSQLFYYNTSDEALAWFKIADPIFQNWRQAYDIFFRDIKPQTFDKNVLCNLVTNCLDIENETKVVINNFYDLATNSQRLWEVDLSENWTDILNSWYTEQHELLIENSSISNGIIHYRDETFLTQEIINELRNTFNTTKTRKEYS